MQLMKQLNLTATRFADKIGVQRSSISHIMSGRNQPSYDFILKIMEKIPYINAEWLLNGKGNMFKNEEEISENEELKNNEGTITQHGVLFESGPDHSDQKMNEQMKAENKVSQVTYVNNTDRIIIFFEDKTFVEYLPRQER